MPSPSTAARAARIIRLMPKIMGSIMLSRTHMAGRRFPDLTFPQYHALGVISGQGTCSVNELAAHLRLAQSTTSQLVDRLVRAGFVHRENSVEDRRRMVVRLTPDGKTMMEKRTRAISDAYQRILGCLSRRDEAAFEHAFEVFAGVADKIDAAFRDNP